MHRLGTYPSAFGKPADYATPGRSSTVEQHAVLTYSTPGTIPRITVTMSVPTGYVTVASMCPSAVAT